MGTLWGIEDMIAGVVASQITTPPGATNWVYKGTSGVYNDAVDRGIPTDRFGDPVTSCSTTSSNDTWLTSNYPPSGYDIGHRIRVSHGALVGGIPTVCQAHYFEAE